MDIKKENKKLIIKKDRCLISISNDITLTQRKVYNALLFNTKKQLLNNTNKRIFEIELTELEKIADIKNTNRVYLKKEIKELMTKTIEFDIIDNDDLNNIDYDVSTFISRVKIQKGVIQYEFSSLILQMIYKPNIFTLLELNQINTLTSKFSLALYEFLKDRKTFIPKISITDCKKMLIGDVELYTEFRNFRLRVLDVATKEITDKTDLIVSYELIKNKNTYTHIKFNAIPKEPEVITIKLENEIIEKIKEFLVKKDKSFDFDSRFEGVEFIKDNDNLIIKTLPELEYKKQWLIDNNFDKKIKNIIFQQCNITFKDVVLK